MELTTVLKLIQKLPKKAASHIIAVDGFGGSGKSTVVAKLSEYLPNSIIVAMDDFIDNNHFYDNDREYAFNRNEIRSKILSLSNAENNYIIVEGISSTHPSLADLYDFTIWVDVPIDVAKSRGKLRDAGNENEDKWDLWAENDLKYFEKYQPRANADAVIVNSNNLPY